MKNIEKWGFFSVAKMQQNEFICNVLELNNENS